MAKFQVFVKASVELDIEADSVDEAIDKAQEEWYEAMQYSCDDVEIEDVYQYADSDVTIFYQQYK